MVNLAILVCVLENYRGMRHLIDRFGVQLPILLHR